MIPDLPVKSIRSKHLLLLAVLGVLCGSMPAQEPMKFEVVSIRPHNVTGNDPSNRQMLPGGRFVATGTSARTLLRIAFGIDNNHMHGVPAWVDDETFDIEGVTEERREVKTPEEFQALILSLLQDRFGLKFHREQKETSVYWLVMDKPGKFGPLLKKHEGEGSPNMSVNGGQTRTMRAAKMPMTEIAAAMTRQAGRPVLDRTNLEGTYDFQISWSTDDSPNATEPPLFTVLKEQLGLRLQAAKGMADELVVDSLSKPSEN